MIRHHCRFSHAFDFQDYVCNGCDFATFNVKEFNYICVIHDRSRSRGLQKGGVLKILGFRRSQNTKITLESTSFWRNICIRFFSFSLFSHVIKAWRSNPTKVSDFINAFIRKKVKEMRCIKKKMYKWCISH